MGTLTAGQPRLDQYCEHKLPTSCRLSSIGECCACYDERAHSAAYPTYIDGVGFVQRGTRWQRYCWFCKEFWENRVQASGLRPGQTRIPERPDLSEFLDRWYEFHRGYRVVTKEDGGEERVAVLGEDFRNVSPGHLPRTLEELRAGRERSELDEREREAARRQQQTVDSDPVGPSIEETLDQMFDAASLEESRPQSHLQQASGQSNNIHAQAIVAAGSRNREYQARRIAALRRELHRMRNGIERVIGGLRDLGQDVPDYSDASDRLSTLGQTLDSITGVPSQEEGSRAIESVNALTRGAATTQSDRTLANMQLGIEEARQQMDEAERNRDQARSELDLAEREFRTWQSRLRRLQQEHRTAENYMRLFGTREEMAAQGDNYESPIGGMFTRAYERFNVAEDVRREERTLRRVLQDEARSGGEEAVSRLAELEARSRDVWGVPHQSTGPPPNASMQRVGSPGNELGPRGDEVALEEYYSLLRRQNWSSEPSAVTQTSTAERHPNQREGEDGALNFVMVAGPPGALLDENPQIDNDRGRDAVFMLTALASSDFQLPSNVSREELVVLLANVQQSSLNERQRDAINALLDSPDIVWSIGLPAERNRRRRQRGEHITFSDEAFEHAIAGITVVHDIECMAEAFQRSSQVRQRSTLSSPEQLATLNRLQRGERSIDDRRVLSEMLKSDAAIGQARELLEQNRDLPGVVAPASVARRLGGLQRSMAEAVRQENYSREELDAQRQATRQLALAAGQVAFRAGPAALLEQMASRDDETRMAYERMQANGFNISNLEGAATQSSRQTFYRPLSLENFNASPAATDSEPEFDDEGKGLDAKDTGRPEEPLDDEQMTVKLDCQICYAQLSDIACLPCGHLAMCKWCSEQHSPTMVHDKTRPRRAAACPVCRKAIRQKVRVFRSAGA